MVGRITLWNFERGFGFIQTPEGKDYFGHIRNWFDNDPPGLGKIVEFEVGRAFSPSKPDQALNIRLKPTQTNVSKLLAGAV